MLLAAFIGGAGFFFGPIIGAVLVTYLQVMLSDITEVWQLYFGLMFIGIVMFAPGRHRRPHHDARPLWRRARRRCCGSLPAYLIALGAGAVCCSRGVIVVIEMSNHLSVKASEGSAISGLT